MEVKEIRRCYVRDKLLRILVNLFRYDNTINNTKCIYLNNEVNKTRKELKHFPVNHYRDFVTFNRCSSVTLTTRLG